MNKLKETFDEDGVVFPIQVFTKEEIGYYREKLEHEVDNNRILENEKRCKSLLLFPWLDEIVHNKVILESVKSILGPNFFCWDTQCWLKEANSEKFVSIHQDATYWNFKQKNGVIVWLAFNDIDLTQGPVEYYLKSHHCGQLYHTDFRSKENYLRRGQTIEDFSMSNFDRVSLVMPAGSISMHHPYIAHGSGKNRSNTRRIGYSLQYVSTNNEPIIKDLPEYGVLVSGKDEYGYIKHSPRPTGNLEYDEINWKSVLDAQIHNHSKLHL